MKYDVFIQGVNVDLVVLTAEIAEKSNWYNWFNNEENMRIMNKHYFPNTREDQVRFFTDQIKGNRTLIQLGIFHKLDQALIGVISLRAIDFINRKCEIGGLIGETKYKIMKYWLEANRLLIAHARNQLNMHRIYGGALSKEVAILYQRMLIEEFI